MSLGLSWPFFFLLKRLFTITINYSRTERMMRRATITVGMTADSAVTPAVIVVTVIVVAVVLQLFSMHDTV